MLRKLFAALVLGILPATAPRAAEENPSPASPLAPEEAIRFLRVFPGLRVELAACEPEVVDPVAIRFDELGRMWVVEMRDYPNGPAAGEKPQSQIRILEDRDGDGRYETGRTFADGLLFATGVLPWRTSRAAVESPEDAGPGAAKASARLAERGGYNGAFVTLSGKVVYLEDTDGDLRADRVEPWYQGFTEENSQLRANHPRLGMDGKIYIANGLRGGAVVDSRRPNEKPLSINGLDFRFDPKTREFEAVTGAGQFGLTFDDFGERFVCSNRNPLKHIVIEERYLRRNGAAGVAAATHDVAAFDVHSHVFPLSRAWTTSNLHAGQFTAACGVCLFRGDALGAEFYGNGFTCDPTGSLVHREIVQSLGATFTSKPDREGIEFLASYDEWFRPVNLEVGPDGALYVVDMYRAVIEHPQFVPDELKNRPDLRYGDERGRIYRIAAEKPPPTPHPANLAAMSDAELVKLLEHPNAWQRETAAQLLYLRRGKGVDAMLEDFAVDSKSPQARVLALRLLQLQPNGISDERLRGALADKHPRVRENAVRLAEPRLEKSESLRQRVIDLSRDDDPRVRFQTALSLGFVADEQALASLVEVGLRDADDPWARRAVALSLKDRAAEALVRLVAEAPKRDSFSEGAISLLAETAAQAGAAGSQQQRLAALEAIAGLEGSDPWRRAQRVALKSLAETMRRRGEAFDALAVKSPPETQAVVKAVFEAASQSARDSTEAADQRIEAIDLLALSSDSGAVLRDLALKEPIQVVRVRAIAAIARGAELEIWRELLARFRRETPAVRSAILDGALARADRIHLLLDEIAAGRISPGEIDQARMNRLLQSRDPQIAPRVKELLAAAIPADRQKVLEEYRSVLRLPADSLRGKQVFVKSCANCHHVGDVGIDVAPDISDSRVKQPEQILTDILQPNRAIDANYISYTVITADGQVLTGVLASETGASITLKQQEGKTVTLARDEIEVLQSNGVSLMPEGLEKDIPPQAMADLIAFIKNWRYLDGRTPLGGEGERE